MKRHVPHGLDIIAVSRWLAPAAAIVGSHHEKFDGSGYPRGLRGEEIPVAARIFAIVDVFDALTSKRPYKPSIPVAEAEAILRRERSVHFDSHLLDAFLPMSEALYSQIGTSAESARTALGEIIHKYFISNLTE